MEQRSIVVTEEEGLVTITLSRPRKKNALDNPAYLQIVEALNAAAASSSVTAVIITGSGDYFCSGTDVAASLVPIMATPINAPVGIFMLTVLRFPKILVAAVNGPAVGIGVTLLAHCDLVYATHSATFWTPFLRIAVVPEFGSSITFPRILGNAVANDMLLMSRVLPSEEALQRGLVSELMPPEGFLQGVKDKMGAVLKEPLGPASLLLYKRMLRRWTQSEIEEVVTEELKALGQRYVAGDTKYALGVTMARQRRTQTEASPKARL